MKNCEFAEFGIVAARRADHAAGERHLAELGLEVRQIRAAGAGAGRVAALRHEARDDTVERRAVVEALAGQFLDPRDVVGREVGTQLDHHPAGRDVHVEGVLGIERLRGGGKRCECQKNEGNGSQNTGHGLNSG